VSERDGPDLDELERRLDLAFASVRPRPEYRTDLWKRLRRVRPGRAETRWANVVLAVAAVILLGFIGILGGAALLLGHRSTAGSPNAASGSGGAGQPFGALPRPANGVRTDSAPRAVELAPTAGGAAVAVGVSPQPPPAVLPVYRYAAGSGPGPGAVVEPAAVPGGLESAGYPSRPVAEALEAARSAASRTHADRVTLTGWRLVYVAVPAGAGGTLYLEPAYEVTGTAESGGAAVPVSLLVPAVVDSALR